MQQVADVGERIAERGDLPVEDGGDLCIEPGDAIAEAVVAVYDARRTLIGDALRQLVVHLVEERELARLRRVPLRVPPLQLSCDVSLFAADVTEAGVVYVDVVHVREDVDE